MTLKIQIGLTFFNKLAPETRFDDRKVSEKTPALIKVKAG